MKHNVGTADRLVRFLLGMGLFSLFFILEGDLRYLSLLGFVGLGTALMGWCPLYAIFGIRSCPRG
ncbi:MAG: DUF2892 domain-containing protein [Rhodospirillales bacterium]|nr:DUF2892 domain-containing protein [Rhodospirillales bacterium]